jgi:hypothetical protein
VVEIEDVVDMVVAGSEKILLVREESNTEVRTVTLVRSLPSRLP